jgi:hypothetical protein
MKQKELIEFRQTYAEVAAGQKRMQKQLQQAEGLMEVCKSLLVKPCKGHDLMKTVHRL